MTTIAELAEDRTVEGVYAVARKDKKRTRNGAPYLALELVQHGGTHGSPMNPLLLANARTHPLLASRASESPSGHEP